MQADPTPLPFRLAGMLRPYQQDGINWLAFLQRCGLHGILADDMGLGKTLQATAIIAGIFVPLSLLIKYALSPRQFESWLLRSQMP